ncbi:MAG: hypothetical protein WCV85_05795 [Patescibacteria group bacterium]|jgi:hypothetical protein
MERAKKISFLVRGFLVVTLGFVGVLTSITTAQALTISPPSIEFTAQPGNQADFVVKLYNETDQKQVLYINTTTFTSGPEAGIPVYDFAAPKEDIATWVKLDPAPIVLEPQGRQAVLVTVDVPANAGPGGHYGVVAFSTTPPTAEGNAKPQVAVAQGIGTLLFVKVEGDVQESAVITSFSVAKDTFTQLPIEFTTVYQNTGNIHLKPVGNVTITNTLKKQSALLAFNEPKGATLPKSSRTYKTTWQTGQNEDLYGNGWNRFWTAFRNERKNFALGKYTATLSVGTGQATSELATTVPAAGVQSSAAISFWVLPWHVLVVYGVGLLVVLFLLIFAILKYNAWIRRRASTKTPPTGE